MYASLNLAGSQTAARPCRSAGRYDLLVDSGEFYASIEPAILAAHRRVLIQVMTFELDAVGSRLWDALVRSPASEKILCVDAFSTVKISDSPVFGPRYWIHREFREEVRQTRDLLRSGRRGGVRIIVTNPVGALWHKYPLRNHKKMMIVDDVAFLGGINFSDHNFRWHDLMVRSDNPRLVETLAQDFRMTIAGINQTARQEVGDARLYLLDGSNSRGVYDALFGEITSARRSIDIISPYLCNPLLSRLRGMSANVKIRIINPAGNNKPILRRALTRAAAGSDMNVLLYQPRMSHLKAALIDDERLILGSYNFDFVGYELQQELVLSTADRDLVRDFRERELEPTLRQCRQGPKERAGWFNWPGWAMSAAETYIRVLRRFTY